MKRLSIIILMAGCFASCNKEELITSETRSGKILGYAGSSFINMGAMQWGTINHHIGTAQYTNAVPAMSSVYNQAMYTPDGLYYVPTPYNQMNIPGKQSYIKWLNTHNGIIDSADSKSASAGGNFFHYTTGLTYSPITQSKYAIQQDTLFAFTINQSTASKSVVRGLFSAPTTLTGLPEYYSTTADNTEPYIYISMRSKIQKTNLQNGTTAILVNDATKEFYGIRYNHHDSATYVIQVADGGINDVVSLMRLNTQTGSLQKIVDLPFSSFNMDMYSATIHCCENKYILFMDKFYNVDIATATVETVTSAEKFQGLIWTND